MTQSTHGIKRYIAEILRQQFSCNFLDKVANLLQGCRACRTCYKDATRKLRGNCSRGI